MARKKDDGQSHERKRIAPAHREKSRDGDPENRFQPTVPSEEALRNRLPHYR